MQIKMSKLFLIKSFNITVINYKKTNYKYTHFLSLLVSNAIDFGKVETDNIII